MSKDVIEHRGKVDWIEGNKVHVHFLSMSACASCHAKGVCTASDMERKEVEVTDYTGRFNEGEEVNVLLKRTMGFKAMIYGYLLPFVLVVITLFIASSLVNNEAVAGLTSLAILVPYYFWLYLRRSHFKKAFIFELQKII
jgi:sigma-E factor negative regulatory protein RseC